MGWEESGFICWGGFGGPHMLVLFYVNVCRMCLQSHLSSQPLTIPSPQIILHIRWCITQGPASHFLAGNREAELKPPLSLHFFFSVFSFCFLFFSSSPIRASVACVGVEAFALCPDPFFLRSFLLISLLGIIACRPRGSGMKYMFESQPRRTQKPLRT